MTKETDPDSRNTDRTDTTMSAVASQGSHCLLIANASQNRYSLPVPIPERSASIPDGHLLVSPVSSAPPRLDALPDFALDGFQKSSIFCDGIDKAVNDINTKYGDFTKSFPTSTSPTSSVAVRDSKIIPRPRFMVPIYVDTPQPRPVIGEIWTKLRSQDEPLQPSKPLADLPKEIADTTSPFHDSHEVDTECSEPENTGTSSAAKEVVSDGASTSASQLAGTRSQECLPAAQTTISAAYLDLSSGSSHADNTVSQNTNANIDVCSDSSAANNTEAASPPDLADEDSMCLRDVDSTSALSHSTSRGHESSLAMGSADNATDSEDPCRTTGANRGRNSSAPSVAALVSKFRRLEQSPADCVQEQDQASVESNSRFIQSYRHRSEDSDKDDSLLSTVTSDGACDGRPSLAVY